jgi:hypothetical protein
MRFNLFKLAARISAVLCVAALALSFRSHWRGDRLRYSHENWTASLTSDDGTVRLSFTAPSALNRRGEPPGWSFSSYPASRTTVSFDGTAYEGFGHAVRTFQLPPGGGQAVRVRRWWAPHWSLVLAFAILPAVYAIRRRLAQQRADAAPHCPACGHELTGMPDHCPACGVELAAEEAE